MLRARLLAYGRGWGSFWEGGKALWVESTSGITAMHMCLTGLRYAQDGRACAGFKWNSLKWSFWSAD